MLFEKFACVQLSNRIGYERQMIIGGLLVVYGIVLKTGYKLHLAVRLLDNIDSFLLGLGF